ncbi:hypothetical protein PhCBS80983_g03649 [Powellomyces hirtus]|uniref:Potassium channel tetramerisation-type BTB domain-containing protein n=1 Tax=Powellomyces hirtus TaxID=109895 RepID=A0A507E1K1_9FUNG|nr:hypothetical protein PhCBS80983_g03649 [Powellomyces hirtus]
MSGQADEPLRYSVYGTAPVRTPMTWTTVFIYLLAAFGLLMLIGQLSGGQRKRRTKKNKRKSRQTAAGAKIEKTVETPGDVSDIQLAKLSDEDDMDDQSSSESEDGFNDYGKVVGESVTNAMVQGAVLLKRSPIPDFLVSMTGYGLEGYKRVNSAFGVEEKIVQAGQKAVSAGITATGIFAHAAIKAGVAYQMAPGRREKELQMLAIKETGDDKPPVKIVHMFDNALPGGIPTSARIDVGTQTGDDVAFSKELQGAPTSMAGSVSSVLATYLESSLRVAGNVATASSEVVLGKDRTLKLLGVDPIEARRNHEAPEDGNVRYLNVGGVMNATTIETLTAVEGSLLAEWFGDENKRASLEVKDGSYVIDRDGTSFRHILNYLRGLPTHLTMSDPSSIQQLIVEAVYYRLPDLAEQLSNRLMVMEREQQSVGELLDKLVHKLLPRGMSDRAALLTVNVALVAGVLGFFLLV